MSLESAGAEGTTSPLEKTLHPYQEDMLDAIQGARNNWVEHAYIDSATGTGKDFVIARAIKQFVDVNPSERILYLAHNRFILNEAAKEIAEANPGISQGRMFGGEFQDQEQVTFATFQTLSRPLGGGRAYEAYDPEEYDVVIVNESHHGPAPTYRPVIEYYRPEMLLGATATAERRDQQDIKDIFGEPIYTLKLEEAIAKGYLVRPDYHVLTDHVRHLDNFSGRLDDVSPKDIKEINGMVFVPKRDEEIANTIGSHLEKIEDPRTIIFCASIGHTEHFNELLPGKSATLHSELSDDEQDRRLKAFQRGEIPTLLVVDMLNEGVDVPEINTVVFLRSTESKTVFFQQLGRGLRKVAGKDKVTILDFVANWDRLTTLQSLQSDIKSYQESRPHEPRTVDTEISFNFSPEALEAVQVVQEARERERQRQPKPKSTPRVDKWAAEDAEIKAMLGAEKLPPRRKLTAAQWQRLSERLLTGDETVIEEIVLNSIYNAYGTAKQYSARLDSNELTVEDHFHHAIEGVYKGIKRYKPDKGPSLRDQVNLGIYGTMTYMANNRGLVRFPTNVHDTIKRIEKAQQKLVPELGSIVLTGAPEFDDKVAEISGIDLEIINDMRQLQQNMEYETLLPVQAIIEKPDDSTLTPDQYALYRFEREKLRESLEELSYRERRVLELRYGLGGDASKTLDEVGQIFNVGRERVRQIENQSLKKLNLSRTAQPLNNQPEAPRPHADKKPTHQLRLEKTASEALAGNLSYRYALKEISEVAPMHVVGLSQTVVRALYELRRQSFGSLIDKQGLLKHVESQVLGVPVGTLSYNEYIKALNLMEEHGLVRTTRNDRGTIIESVGLVTRIGFGD